MNPLMSKFERIDENSRLPKYRQVINTILEEINQELFKPGDRIPSINETSEEYYLSRDTVEKAYRELSQRGVISSIPGKGYYVNGNAEVAKVRVMIIFDKLTDHQKVIFNSFAKSLGKRACINLHVHHSDFKCFEELILDNIGNYDYYVIMPHFYDYREEVEAVLKKIPRNKLLVLDRQIKDMDGSFSCIYQDFAKDLEGALFSGLDLLKKYRKLFLVYPQHIKYPPEIRVGFRNFCHDANIDYELIPSVSGHSPRKGEAYIVLEESDLIELVKKCQKSRLELGKDLGIVSYNDTPLKEVVGNGITVISTDPITMGQVAADMIIHKKRDSAKNPFYLLRRNSL
ncbi:MAG: GntR family transcriptional regulator [Bacteroidia bacterium]|nr:GntR family transcriptional regulator [Bacteroidia bacterium]